MFVGVLKGIDYLGNIMGMQFGHVFDAQSAKTENFGRDKLRQIALYFIN